MPINLGIDICVVPFGAKVVTEGKHPVTGWVGNSNEYVLPFSSSKKQKIIGRSVLLGETPGEAVVIVVHLTSINPQ